MNEQNISLEDFKSAMETLLRKETEMELILQAAPALLQALVRNPDCIRELLTQLATDEELAANYFPAIDPNDISVFQHPEGLFTMRLFVWHPHSPYPPHDHGSWGIVGALAGQTREIRFKRKDDQTKPGYAEIEAFSQRIISPGETTVVRPIDEGIHQMSPAADNTTLTLHVYGKAIRKGFIQAYHPFTKAVYRIYSHRQLHRVMALQALGGLGTPWAKQLLMDSLSDSRELIRDEAQQALSRLTE